ncbi:MAG: hypothetical protein CMJ76_05185 [Planctomycetaceae bacterium]|nr:hypothetical protein [Planctomycetaceae bacterium]|tara:strand:+ start:5808 stop:6341 length:534 start_codon:yes stop_codon:yes gene_type:complete
MKQNTQGKLVIIGIFGVAILMSVYAWWHNIHTGDQVIQFFGIETATRLRHANKIELLILNDEPASSENMLKTSMGRVSVKSVQDMSSTRGLVHMRHIFIQDHTYEWEKGIPEMLSGWSFALRFSDSSGQTTLAFAPSTYLVEHLETGKLIVMGELLDNLIRYLAESKLISLEDVTSS